MKYYSALASKFIFSFDDALKFLKTESNTKRYLYRMIQSGQINRIKKNLYSLIDPATQTDMANHFLIATHINKDSFVSYHSAFEFYGFYNQTYTTVQVSSLNKFIYFEYNDYLYHCILTKTNKQIDVIQK